MPNLAALATTLRELHKPGDPLLLANVWDAASARMVEELGFPALATSSAAVAATLGENDTDSMPAELAFGAVRRIASAVALPVTADLEAGYGLSAQEFVTRLLASGAVGCNLEDSDHHGEGSLVDLDVQTTRITGVKEAARRAGVDIVLNARVDAWVRHIGEPDMQLAEGIRRGRAYLAAGADCVYPILLGDERGIGAFVDGVGGPVNVMFRKGVPSLDVLRRLGVARVSLAGALFRAAMAAAKTTAEQFRAGTLFSD